MKVQVINQLINFFWTILCFAPVIYYWLGNHSVWLYGFLIFSLIFAFLPAGFFRVIQLSNNRRSYEKLGVKLIQKFVQNGTYANRKIRKNDPAYNVIRDRTQARRYLSTIYMYERYHLMCFVFFGLTFIHSLIRQQYLPALVILAANVVYNICPLLLQQYNKLRMMRVLKLMEKQS